MSHSRESVVSQMSQKWGVDQNEVEAIINDYTGNQKILSQDDISSIDYIMSKTGPSHDDSISLKVHPVQYVVYIHKQNIVDPHDAEPTVIGITSNLQKAQSVADREAQKLLLDLGNDLNYKVSSSTDFESEEDYRVYVVSVENDDEDNYPQYTINVEKVKVL